MIRFTTILVACTALADPVLAWETPVPVSDVSPVCTVVYNPNEGVQVHAEPGMTLTIQLGDTRTIKQVAVSDHAHLKTSQTANVLWLKPTEKMQAQPISIRAERDDGKAELYILEWLAEAPPDDRRACDLVRFTYPQDAIEARKADQEKRRQAWEAAAASRALHAAASQPGGSTTGPSVLNKAYTITGSTDLLPAQLAPVQPQVTASVTPPPPHGATR